MRVVVLHSEEALEPPEDPVLDQVTAALDAIGHDARRLCVGGEIEHVIAALRRAHPDLVFNLTESFAGVSALDSNLAALLNLLGLQYTGSSPAGLLLAGDKSLANQVLRFHAIRTPASATVFRGAVDWAGDIAFPLIVKPPQEDASIGITGRSVVHDVRELFERIDQVQSEFGTHVLVEEFVDGREFYVGVLGNLSAEALPVMELTFTGFPAGAPRVASWEAKWGPEGTGAAAESARSREFAGTRAVFPTDLDDALVERMQQMAVRAFEALRLRDYARVDLRVTPAGEIVVIEVNPNCYLEREAEFARSAERGGLSYHALMARIVELARARYAR